jgi:hypothetical protein
VVAHDDLVPDESVDAPADYLPPGPHLPAELPDPDPDSLDAWMLGKQLLNAEPPEDPWADAHAR